MNPMNSFTSWAIEQMDGLTDAEITSLHLSAIGFGQKAEYGDRREAVGWFIYGWLATREKGRR